MARDRQRAKQRQAERRAARLAERRAAGGAAEGDARDGDSGSPENRGVAAPADPALDPALAAAAPPEETGRSDALLDAPAEDEAALDEDDALLEEEAVAAEPAPSDGRAHAGGYAPGRQRSRVVDFLVAVWAELKRVQWPDRQALTTLTGVVLVFVVLVGLYLGGLDAIFAKLIEAIL